MVMALVHRFSIYAVGLIDHSLAGRLKKVPPIIAVFVFDLTVVLWREKMKSRTRTREKKQAFVFVAIYLVVTVLFMVFVLAGCQTGGEPVQTTNHSQTVQRHDLKLKVNNVSCIGACVVEPASSYHVKVFPEERIDRIVWQTCHREVVVDQPKTGWFDTGYEFDVVLQRGIEDVTACALEITTLSQKSRVGFALVEFQDARPEVALPATLKCNGEWKAYPKGVSVCQTAAGLKQQIEFQTSVVITGVAPGCDVMQSDNEKVFRFNVAPGKCTYYFVSNLRNGQGTRLIHRLSTIGYSEIPVR